MFLPVVLCGSVRASAAAAGPTAPAGAVYALAIHPAYCRSDAACTVPCGVGDGIRWMQELVTGTWHEQAANGKRPIMRYDATYGWYSEGDGAGRKMVISFPSSFVAPLTAGVRYKMDGFSNTYCPVFGAGITQQSILGPWSNPVAFSGARGFLTGGIGWLAYGSIEQGNEVDTEYSTDIGQAQSGLQGRFYADGVEVLTNRGTPGSDPSWGSECFIHGAYLDEDGFTSQSRFYRAAFYGSVLDASGRSGFTTWLEAPNR